MLMPIVSMNKMAMNESVATTCCFKEVASPTNVYWSTLNGGWIGQGYVEADDWNAFKPSASWRALGYDVVNYVDGKPIALPGLTTTTAANGDVTYVVDTYGSYGPPCGLEVWFTQQTIYRKGGACDHKSAATCKYRSWDIQWKSNYHFDAQTKHGVDLEWKLPHAAFQFSS